jgi:hypothetical protein
MVAVAVGVDGIGVFVAGASVLVGARVGVGGSAVFVGACVGCGIDVGMSVGTTVGAGVGVEAQPMTDKAMMKKKKSFMVENQTRRPGCLGLAQRYCNVLHPPRVHCFARHVSSKSS